MKLEKYRGKTYYLYDSYDTLEKAVKIGRKYKKKNKSKYIIREVEEGLWFPEKKWELYLTKVITLS